MSRRLSIAMALSAAIHVTAFVIVDRMFEPATTPGNPLPLLLVSLESQSPGPDPTTVPTAPASRERYPLDAATQPAPLDATQPAPFNAPAESSTDAAISDSAVQSKTAAVTAAAPVPSAAMTFDSSPAAHNAPDAVRTVLVTDGSGADWSVPERVTLSVRQKKMLDRKIRHWSRDLDGQDDLLDGINWTHDGQAYDARFSPLPTDDEVGIQRVLVEISTIENGRRLSSQLQLKRLAFSNFAQFVNRWDPEVQIHDDELDGRFHANSEINLVYDGRTQPVFHSKVTTTARSVDLVRVRGPRRRDEIFLGGLETGVPSIPLPRRFVPFSAHVRVEDSQVHRLSVDTRIVFRADGSYLFQSIDSTAPKRTGYLSGETTYIIADKGAAVHVRGIVNGKVLVYSPHRIVIEDDLLYAENPENTAGSDDFLGLVSDRYVDVAPPEVTGPGDLLIHAAIYAKRRFAVRKIRHGEGALLYLYGSLSAGTLSATEPRYATRIRFDHRLDELRPPGFPMTDRYEVESWDAEWTVDAVH